MPGQIVTANTLTAGIRSDFADAYKSAYNASKERLSNVMDMGIPSDKLIELYAYFETAPFPRLWKRGDAIPRDAFESVQFNVENRDWAIRVEWHENDREDDQTRSLMQRARDAGANFATLPERVWFQILTAAASTELLPAIPNAPDGASMFSGCFQRRGPGGCLRVDGSHAEFSGHGRTAPLGRLGARRGLPARLRGWK